MQGAAIWVGAPLPRGGQQDAVRGCAAALPVDETRSAHLRRRRLFEIALTGRARGSAAGPPPSGLVSAAALRGALEQELGRGWTPACAAAAADACQAMWELRFGAGAEGGPRTDPDCLFIDFPQLRGVLQAMRRSLLARAAMGGDGAAPVDAAAFAALLTGLAPAADPLRAFVDAGGAPGGTAPGAGVAGWAAKHGAAVEPDALPQSCVIVAPAGALVRAGEALSSPPVCEQLPQNSVVDLVETKGRRGRIAAPVRGWLSVATAEGLPIVRRVEDAVPPAASHAEAPRPAPEAPAPPPPAAPIPQAPSTPQRAAPASRQPPPAPPSPAPSASASSRSQPAGAQQPPPAVQPRGAGRGRLRPADMLQQLAPAQSHSAAGSGPAHCAAPAHGGLLDQAPAAHPPPPLPAEPPPRAPSGGGSAPGADLPPPQAPAPPPPPEAAVRGPAASGDPAPEAEPPPPPPPAVVQLPPPSGAPPPPQQPAAVHHFDPMGNPLPGELAGEPQPHYPYGGGAAPRPAAAEGPCSVSPPRRARQGSPERRGHEGRPSSAAGFAPDYARPTQSVCARMRDDTGKPDLRTYPWEEYRGTTMQQPAPRPGDAAVRPVPLAGGRTEELKYLFGRRVERAPCSHLAFKSALPRCQPTRQLRAQDCRPGMAVRATPHGFAAGRDFYIGTVVERSPEGVLVKWEDPQRGGPPETHRGQHVPRKRLEPRDWWNGPADARLCRDGWRDLLGPGAYERAQPQSARQSPPRRQQGDGGGGAFGSSARRDLIRTLTNGRVDCTPDGRYRARDGAPPGPRKSAGGPRYAGVPNYAMPLRRPPPPDPEPPPPPPRRSPPPRQQDLQPSAWSKSATPRTFQQREEEPLQVKQRVEIAVPTVFQSGKVLRPGDGATVARVNGDELELVVDAVRGQGSFVWTARRERVVPVGAGAGRCKRGARCYPSPPQGRPGAVFAEGEEVEEVVSDGPSPPRRASSRGRRPPAFGSTASRRAGEEAAWGVLGTPPRKEGAAAAPSIGAYFEH